MSAADVLTFQPQFSGIASLALALFPLEFAQNFGNALYYYYYPEMESSWAVGRAWLWFGVLALAALLVMLPVGMLMNKCQLRNKQWRMRVYDVLWLPAIIQAQAAAQLPVYNYCGAAFSNNCQLWFNATLLAITSVVAAILCWILCTWCNPFFMHLDEVLLGPIEGYTQVSTTQQ